MSKEKKLEYSVLVCTVGGTPDPVRESINAHKPTHVIFVASPESRKTIAAEITSKISYTLVDSETITLNDFQDLVTCVKDIRENIPSKLHAMSLPEDTPLIADITGGTKSMSAALTLAMMEFPSRFSYVGGSTRSKDGLGVVESGSEVVMHQANPWDVLALREVQTLCYSFNHGQFYDAKLSADKLAKHVEEENNKKFYAIIAEMINGYMLWDHFDQKKAFSSLRQAKDRLQPYTLISQRIFFLAQTLAEHVTYLDKVQQEARALQEKSSQCEGKTYLLDILANARRRASQGHFDDAVARLYSTIEKAAKIRLWIRHNLDNSNIDLDKIPREFHEEYTAYANSDRQIKIGLQQSFLLLARLGDELGQTYFLHQKDLENQLQYRNQSLLAHGYLPIGQEKYQKLFDLALTFLGIKESDLVDFPHIDWKALLF